MSRADRLESWRLRAARSSTVLAPGYGSTVHYSEVAAAADHRSCPSQVRAIQGYHMDSQGWSDIAYSDLVCQHGAIYEGRGPLKRTAANGTDAGNDAAHAVCALLASGQTPTTAMLDAIVDSAVFLNSQSGAGDRVNGHRDWKSTGCPGDPLYGHVPTIDSRVRAILSGSAPTITEDDMDPICVPSWGTRQAGNRLPFFRLIPGTEAASPYTAKVLAYPGAPLLASTGTVPGWRLGDTFGIPTLFMAGLNGRAIAIEEGPGGAVVVVTEDGGTFDVAKRP